MLNKKQVIIIGGGAAGVFAAIRIKELYPHVHVTILEKTLKLLTKVKISGGGRCNVTHHQFQPKELVKNYPRGEKELLGPFHFFQPTDMIAWLEQRGVILKTESDGRMFPVSDSSSTIIDCFLKELKKHQVEIIFETEMTAIKPEENQIILQTNQGDLIASTILIATGSLPKNFERLKEAGIEFTSLVPSLFTFHIPNSFLHVLSGTSFPYAELKICNSPYKQIGPVLITHFGLSGPCTLKLSAFAARFLHEKNYTADLLLNVDASTSLQDKIALLLDTKKQQGIKILASIPPFGLTKNCFTTILEHLKIDPKSKWIDLSSKKIEMIANFCDQIPLKMHGKSIFKEEFVTAGGVNLKQVNLKTMEHKIQKRIFFAGEVLDIDGITGGFNFQNAWTSATIAAHGMENYLVC